MLLEFETEVETIENEIRTLRHSDEGDAADILNRIQALQKRRDGVLKKIYSGLDDWQTCQVARHPDRPQTLDYIAALLEDFLELYGDRAYADDRAIICGIARFESTPVIVFGHQKGHDTKEKLNHNFGMSGPEGYRKILRVMDLANKFSLPLISFIDTPGAYPGIGAEERGQSGAIGMCLRRSVELQVPYINVVIGEGGSGGALAMGVGDWTMMLEHSIYSVISPEGCASILWKDGSRAPEAAGLLGLTAHKLKKLKLIDEIIPEPVGGAHRQQKEMAETLRESIARVLKRLLQKDASLLLQTRQQRWRDYGVYKEVRS